MRDDPGVVALVVRARDGDADAWDEIVERYAPLVWAVCQRFRLARADADDVGQSVWLRLVEALPALREPAALPGWLATTTRRECLRVAGRRERPEDPADLEGTGDTGGTARAVDAGLLAAERDAAMRAALRSLPERCRRLLTMVTDDPPVPYARISAALDIPVGSIGPTRARCLDKLRRSAALAPYLDAGHPGTGGGGSRGRAAVDR